MLDYYYCDFTVTVHVFDELKQLKNNGATHEAEKADAVDTRATTAEKAHDGEDETKDHQCDGHLVDDDDRLSLVVDEQRPQPQRFAFYVQPYPTRYQRPTADLYHSKQ